MCLASDLEWDILAQKVRVGLVDCERGGLGIEVREQPFRSIIGAGRRAAWNGLLEYGIEPLLS